MRNLCSISEFLLSLTLFLAAPICAAEGDKTGDRPLAGIVRDAGGKPVADADVWLVTASLRGEAEVYDQTKSGARGEFRLTLPGRWADVHRASRQEIGVVAYQPAAGLAVVCYSRFSVPLESGVVLQTKAPSRAALRIVSPSGEPVAGAKVSATMQFGDAIYTELAKTPGQTKFKPTSNGPVLGRLMIFLPAELTRRFSSETDRDGRATISGMELADIAAIKIETTDYGTQITQVMSLPASNDQPPPTLPETIPLAPVGALSARLTGDDAVGRQVSEIIIHSFPPFDERATKTIYTSGRAKLTPDAQGRINLPAVVAGTLFMIITPVKDSPLRAKLPPESAREVKAGMRTELEIPLVRAVRASGVVRERGSQRPIAGVHVAVGNYGMSTEQVVTDEQGRFTCLTRPGQIEAWPIPPANYALPANDASGKEMTTIPDNATEFEFPPIDLTPLTATGGVVVAADGGPAAGAKVRARWFALDASSGQSSLNDASLLADDQGAFTLAAVDPEKELLVEARSQAGFGSVRLKLKDLAGESIELKLVAADLISLSGRAVDTAGKPLAGAKIEIWTMPQTIESFASSAERVNFDQGVEIHADDEGNFQTPRELDRQSTYQARLALPDREPAATQWLAAHWRKTTTFDDLIVRRVTSLAGCVVDRQGRPVAEASVFQSGDAPQRVQTTTDADGRFRLPEVMADPTFVFVSKPGFRFFGRLVGGDDNENSLELAMTRSGEPVERPGQTLPRRLTKEARAALALRVLAPCLKEGAAQGEAETNHVLDALAAADPPALLERLEKSPSANPFLVGMLKRSAAQALAIDDLDEALAVVESIGDLMFRSMSYLDAADSLGDDQRERKLELLGQASVAARQIGEPAMKAIMLGQTAERLLDAGQREQATALLREGETIAKQLPLDAFGGYARGAFAEELVQIDQPAALELMKGLSDVGEFDRHHGNAAHELAAADPAAAERLLGMLHPAAETRNIYEPRESWGVRVCYRMAPVDLARARRLADSFANPYLQAQAYGAMAQAIGAQQREAAIELIERAFAVLDKLVRERDRNGLGDTDNLDRDQFFRFLFSASSLAGTLLPNVESVDPELVPEYFWRAVSFRLPRSGNEQAVGAADRANLILAMMLARYDREVAGAILKPIRARITVFQGSRDASLAAAVLVDPQAAVEAVEAIREEKPNCLLRAELAQLLVLEGEPLWRKLQNMLSLWAIDVEDLF